MEGPTAHKTLASSVAKGASATYSTTLGAAGITSVQPYAVSLDAVDSLGLPAAGASATLTSSGGVSVTLSQGETKMLQSGSYTLVMNYGGQTIREAVTVGRDGPVSARVAISVYSEVLVAVVVVAIGGSIFFLRMRRGTRKKTRTRVSEWLK